MLIALFSTLFSRRNGFRWQPSIEIRDGQTAATLGIYSRD
ncbi:hypothetical protein BN1110_04536 [bacterium YEK0313]|nr:hypothetical protein BN1110_04536 [bacterium YEK0313]